MKKQLSTLLLTLYFGTAIATGIFNVRDYGAKGDGKTLDSPAINAAIEAAVRDGGGQVLLPAGTYLSGSIRLKSNIDLHLSAGCTILAAPASMKAYDPSESFGGFPEYQDGGHTYFHNSLIWAEANVIVTDCDSLCSIIVTGMKDEPIRNVWLSNIRLTFRGGGTKDLVKRDYREQGTNYPEPRWAGPAPAYGLYARHVEGLHVNDVTFRYERPEYRPAIILDDVRDATLNQIDAPTEPGVEQIIRF